MGIEKRFDIKFVAKQALREKQIQQSYRPIIAVHKWFARRPGTLFRALILAEFGERPTEEIFFKTNSFPRKRIADPFVGGGTPLIEANRLGCDVQGFDINPMATWIVREEIDHLDVESYRRESKAVLSELSAEVDNLYRTDCPLYGDRNVPVKYFIWVKEIDCEKCGEAIPLFPGFLLSRNVRHPLNVLVCGRCGALNEAADKDHPGACRSCRDALSVEGTAKQGTCRCPKCNWPNTYPRPNAGAPRHRLIAIEYHNQARRHSHQGRFFKEPDALDLERFRQAEQKWKALRPQFVPNEEIPPGDETDRLHRWGYRKYRELFNPRQLLGLELSARLINKVKDARIRRALCTNFSDLLRYQNMLCRYDSMALKSLDIFSVHGFPVGLIQCESNLLGILNPNGGSVGSGGWTNITSKYARAKEYCEKPFEVREARHRNTQVPVKGEWIGEHKEGAQSRTVSIRCASSTKIDLASASLDAVFTDPPYFGNVQYGELMDFCYVWLRRLIGQRFEGFDRTSTRSTDELTGNETQGRGLDQFTEGLATVYRKMAAALKPGAPLAFTYHHNKPEAYHAVGVAILDAGLTCSATIPCPAEMGSSIHIHGTGSSIIDTVFVCRSTGTAARYSLAETQDDLVNIVASDLRQLRLAGVKPTAGDSRCIVLGHATRMAVWKLRKDWDHSLPTGKRLALLSQEMSRFGNLAEVAQRAKDFGLRTEGQTSEPTTSAQGTKRTRHAASL